MAYNVPNASAAAYPSQARLFSQDLQILQDALAGTGWTSGAAVTAQGTPDMTLAVASGTVKVAGTDVTVTAGNVTITAANGSNPRIDMVVVNSSGTKSVTAGTAAAQPEPASIPASSVVLAFVYVPANDTTIGSDQIIDKRATAASTGGGAAIVDYDRKKITSGDYATGSEGFGWRQPFGTAQDIVLTCTAGDIIEAGICGMWVNAASSDYMDVVSITSGTHLSGEDNASTGVGNPGWMAKGNAELETPISGSIWYTSVSGDISGGNITLRVKTRTSSGRTLRANTTIPFFFFAINHGQP